MIILDTNVLSELMKPKKSEIVRNWAVQQSLTDLFTTTITQAEILYGIAYHKLKLSIKSVATIITIKFQVR
ncbi:PilT protein domain protein [Calothrix sp. PCC 6303]|uniref:PIN domain-containing protein n=1 Tax=Calothrix sp. PCC 6303 TaxID=1170562 RepID=UPI0002A03A00|nr:PIN domain-containing protein [Calothrix sp. PCC 6303]AFZ00134.1 PilT protein domain protein [Calothrix sp. PCC 6303]